MDFSIVTTLYCSAPYVEEFYNRVRSEVEKLSREYEIIFVNDGSPDNSLELAIALHEKDCRVKVIDLSRNFGHHKAIMTGLAHAKGNLVFLLDSDLEEEPELLGKFYKEMQESSADVIYGVQQTRKGNFFERITGNIFYRILNLLSHYPIPSNLITARLMSRRYVASLVEHKDQEIFLAGLWAITGFKQVALAVRKLSKGNSSYTLMRKISAFVAAITSFSNKPLVFIFYLGSIIVLASSAAAMYLIVRRIFFGVFLAGWPSLIVSLWLLGGLTIFCVGLIGIYLSKIFTETKQRPYTVIRKIYETEQRKEAEHGFNIILKNVESYYTEKIRMHGATARGVDWNSPESQALRFEQLLKVCDHSKPFSLNDYGCGYGALVGFMLDHSYNFHYRGFDISGEMIAKALELCGNNGKYEFTTDESLLSAADYTVASGIFNVKLQTGEKKWQEYVLSVLRKIAQLSEKGFAFNMLTQYSDRERMRPDLYYADPLSIFDYCKSNFSKHVSLSHDYPLYEFTILVKK